MEEDLLICHAVEDPGDAAWDAPITTVIALCGDVALIEDSGDITPDNFDFVCIGDPDWQKHVDCPGCLEEMTRPKQMVRSEGVG